MLSNSTCHRLLLSEYNFRWDFGAVLNWLQVVPSKPWSTHANKNANLFACWSKLRQPRASQTWCSPPFGQQNLTTWSRTTRSQILISSRRPHALRNACALCFERGALVVLSPREPCDPPAAWRSSSESQRQNSPHPLPRYAVGLLRGLSQTSAAARAVTSH